MKKLNLDWIDALLIAFGLVLLTVAKVALNLNISHMDYTQSIGHTTPPGWWTGDFVFSLLALVFTAGPLALRRKLFGAPPAPASRQDESKISALSLLGLFVVLIGTALLAATCYITSLHSKDWAGYVLWIGIFAVMIVLGALCLRAASPPTNRDP